MRINFHLGIREKITAGFYILLALMIAIAALTYAITWKVAQKVEFVEFVDDFLNMTLEVRRFEKNYFLYGHDSEFREFSDFLSDLEGLLSENQVLVEKFITNASHQRLRVMLKEYRGGMKQLKNMNMTAGSVTFDPESRFELEDKIRSIGKELTDLAEKISKSEREAIIKLIATARTMLVISILVLSAMGVIIATVLGRRIVRSLKILEEQTRSLSRGEFSVHSLNEKNIDPEIKSLLQAFNRMTNELRLRQQQLVQSEKLASLGTLLSGVAHELNNPLSNISTSAQILSEEIEENDDLEFKRELVGQIVEQTERAGDIVRTLLEFSRIREFDKQRLRVKKLIDETIVLLRGQLPSEVSVELEIPEELEIMADKQRLQQVCLNLIKNGVDALAGRGNIWVTAREVAREAQPPEVEIMIEDNGPGIPAEQVKKIFDPFFTTKDVGHGSGLGLFIVHDIIEWHGGSIQVDSRPGEGTTFIIWLPMS